MRMFFSFLFFYSVYILYRFIFFFPKKKIWKEKKTKIMAANTMVSIFFWFFGGAE